MRVVALSVVFLSTTFRSEVSLAERSVFDCATTTPEVEIRKALELVQMHLTKNWPNQKRWPVESAILECHDQKRSWEVHARPQPDTGKKLLLRVQMDGIVSESGLISDG